MLCEIGLEFTENREVTGSTPVGATVPFPGFYGGWDFFYAFSDSLAGAAEHILSTTAAGTA